MNIVITRSEQAPGAGRRKIPQIFINIFQQEDKSSARYAKICSLTAAEFLKITYNTIILNGISALLNTPGFNNDLSYQCLANWIAWNVYDNARGSLTSDQKERDLYQKMLQMKTDDANLAIYTEVTYQFTPEYSCTFRQNIEEMIFIVESCWELFKKSEAENKYARWYFRRKTLYEQLDNDEALHEYIQRGNQYLQTIRAVMTTSTCTDENNRPIQICSTDSLSRIIYTLVSLAIHYDIDTCRICRYCTKAFIPASKKQTMYCSRECCNANRRFETETVSGRIHKQIENKFNSNIYDYSLKESPNVQNGKKARREWQAKTAKYSRLIKNRIQNIIISPENYDHDEKKEMSMYEDMLIAAAKETAEKNNFEEFVKPEKKYNK